MTLYVDTSRIGMHGIGRYSREVIARLDMPWTDLGQRLRRPLPLDAVNPRRMMLASDDVVYAPGFNAGLTRARQFLTIHDLIHLEVESEGSRLKTLYYDRIVKPAVKRSKLAFTVSETSQKRVEEWLDDSSVEVVNTGNGVSDAFTPNGPAWNELHHYFVYVGNLKEHKNVDVVLDALTLTEDFRLVLVTSDRDEARRRVAARGLEARVVILSSIDDQMLASIYRGSLAVVMPSTVEGFGLPAAEAIACGKPVLFWRGCASVAEIAAGHGVDLGSSKDAHEWADGLHRIAAAEFRGSAVSRPWAAVAAIVRAALEATP